jgi:hypothetical protein
MAAAESVSTRTTCASMPEMAAEKARAIIAPFHHSHTQRDKAARMAGERASTRSTRTAIA